MKNCYSKYCPSICSLPFQGVTLAKVDRSPAHISIILNYTGLCASYNYFLCIHVLHAHIMFQYIDEVLEHIKFTVSLKLPKSSRVKYTIFKAENISFYIFFMNLCSFLSVIIMSLRYLQECIKILNVLSLPFPVKCFADIVIILYA